MGHLFRIRVLHSLLSLIKFRPLPRAVRATFPPAHPPPPIGANFHHRMSDRSPWIPSAFHQEVGREDGPNMQRPPSLIVGGASTHTLETFQGEHKTELV